nr:fumarylacetoacetate hydrolase family protein [uncultured Roseateles sp.]
MQLITFETARGPRLGALLNAELVLDLAQAAERQGDDAGPVRSMLALIQAGEPGLALVRRLLHVAEPAQCLQLASLRLLAPLPVPEQIRDFANYELHVRQALASSMRLRANAAPDPEAALQQLQASGMFAIPPVWYERPLYFKCNRFSVVGPDAVVEWPPFAQKMDYELELAVVIGKKVRDVPEAEAMDAVFGYTIYNDFSARDVQAHESQFRMGPAKGKDFDTGNVFGPCITTRDAIADPYALQMSVAVNGEVKTRTTAAGMQHSIARCISFLSQSETLYPGEILAMGTVGNGCGYESLSFLNEGDEVTLEVQGIGRLSNTLRRVLS